MLQTLIVTTWLKFEVVNMTIGVADNIVRELQEIVTNNFPSEICRLVLITCGVSYLCWQHKKMVTESSEKVVTTCDSTWCLFAGDPVITRRQSDVRNEIKKRHFLWRRHPQFYSVTRNNSCSMRKKTNKSKWRNVNLLRSKGCQTPTYFGHILWPSTERCFTKDTLKDITNSLQI